MKKFLSSKLARIGLIIVAVGLILGLALPGVVAAKENSRAPDLAAPNTLKGKVDDIASDKTSFDINTASGETVTINVDSNTKYYQMVLPIKPAVLDRVRERIEQKLQKGLKDIERGKGNKYGQANLQTAVNEAENESVMEELQAGLPKLWRERHNATFDDIAVGDTVVVRVMPNENLAKQVLIVETKISSVHGRITSVSQGAITITRPDNTAVDLTWDANTRFILKGIIQVQAGQTATAFYNTDTKLAKLVIVSITPEPATSSSTST